RWLLWRLPMAQQSTAELSQLAEVLDPAGADPGPGAAANAGLRERLRGADSVPAPGSSAKETAALVMDAAPGAEPDPRFVPLDLGPALNVPLNGAWPTQRSPGGDFPTLAPG